MQKSLALPQIRWVGCALAILFGLSVPAKAEVSEIIDYTYYELSESGRGQPLKAQLDAATPIERDGRKLHGDTHWKLDWRFNTEALEDGRCKITDIDIHLDALIRLPAIGYQNAELQTEFNRYTQALQRHQIGHYIVAVQAANKIDVRLMYMEPVKNCEAARDQAQAMAVDIEKEFREKDIAFDEKTDYGAEQGMSFSVAHSEESKVIQPKKPSAKSSSSVPDE